MKVLKLRDFLALPFLFLSLLFETIAIKVGGIWTADTILESYKKSHQTITELTK